MKKSIFRAWDISTSTMSYEVELHRFSDGYGFRMELNHFKKHWIHVEEKYVMQLAGFKDIDRKEIYAGDIMGDEYGRVCSIVKFKDGSFYHDFIEKDKGEPFYEKILMNLTTDDKPIRSCWKVMGNIYKNPELLKEGDKK